MWIALLSNDPKVGSYADQRKLFSEGIEGEIVEYAPGERYECLVRGLRAGDVLLLSAARVLGTYRERDRWLADLASRDIAVQLPGGEPVIYDTPEKRAKFHAEAVKPTGRPSRKQKALMGRPPKHRQPTEDELVALNALWHSDVKRADAIAAASEIMGYDVKDWQMKQWCGDKRRLK